MKQYCMSCMEPLGEGGVCRRCGFTVPSAPLPHQLAPGTLLKERRYLIGKVIGQGGFGITYIGRDTLLDVRVAV